MAKYYDASYESYDDFKADLDMRMKKAMDANALSKEDYNNIVHEHEIVRFCDFMINELLGSDKARLLLVKSFINYEVSQKECLRRFAIRACVKKLEELGY